MTVLVALFWSLPVVGCSRQPSTAADSHLLQPINRDDEHEAKPKKKSLHVDKLISPSK